MSANERSGKAAGTGLDSPYLELLTELDASIQALRAAAFRLKQASQGMQAVERNVDRVLASARMLEINVSDLLHEPESLASWTDDEDRM